MEELTTSALKEEEFSKKIDLKIWKRLLRYALRYKGIFIGVILLMLFCAAIDIIYPQLTRYAIDSIIAKGEDGFSSIVPFGIAYLLLIVLQGISVIGFIMLCGKLELLLSALKMECRHANWYVRRLKLFHK